MSHVTCHGSHVTFFLLLLLSGQSGEGYRWRVCYQWGLPRLVFGAMKIILVNWFLGLLLVLLLLPVLLHK